MDLTTIVRCLVVLNLLIAANSFATPQKSYDPALTELNEFSGAKALADGIEVNSRKAVIQITSSTR